MKLRVLIRIAVIVSIVLLCTGFGAYSFLRMNAVENQQDFNLFTLVPQDATAILETDRMADMMEDINGLYCSKDDHFLYVSDLFVYLKKYLNALVGDTPHGLSKQMNKMLISFHEPDTPLNQVLYCSLGTGDYELVETFVRKYCSSTFPSKYFDYNGEEIRIYPMTDGRFLAAYFTSDFLAVSFQKRLIEQVIDAHRSKQSLMDMPSFRTMYAGKRNNVAATVYVRMKEVAGKDANPMYTTTFGVGELIRAALDAGCRKIRVGAGGSATTDGGIGCLMALGARFTDKTGEEVPPMGCGLSRVACINLDGLDERLREADVTVLCDVKSPLYGAQGAAFVFAPQKGALPKQVQTLDNALRAFAQTLLRYTGSDIRSLVGAGAAGGLAGGLCAMLGAHLAGGVETLLCEAGFDALALRSSLVVTGEGRIDEQSMQGKVPWGVAKHAPHTPVIAIAGGVQGDRSTLACQMGLVRIYEANYRQRPPHEIGRYCREDLEYIAVRAAKEFLQDCKASAD